MKIITSLLFFVNEPKEAENPMNLRELQNHFMKDDDPLSFSEYTDKLSSLYSSIQNRLLWFLKCVIVHHNIYKWMVKVEEEKNQKNKVHKTLREKLKKKREELKVHKK